MSAFNQRPPAGAHPGQPSSASSIGPSAPPLHEQPQPVASSSRNPQLGPHPYFRYPAPTPEQVEDELPPYWEDENVPLGPLLDRLARKSYSDMRTLVDKTFVSPLQLLTPACLHSRRGRNQNMSSSMPKQRARPSSSTSPS